MMRVQMDAGRRYDRRRKRKVRDYRDGCVREKPEADSRDKVR